VRWKNYQPCGKVARFFFRAWLCADHYDEVMEGKKLMEVGKSFDIEKDAV
jgi:hypothetical protein